MEEAPPPTHHVIRPHHVALLKISMLTFKDYQNRLLPPVFLLHVFRVLLNEVAEARPQTKKSFVLSEKVVTNKFEIR
jgi:anaphase-promoting complex subunit 5